MEVKRVEDYEKDEVLKIYRSCVCQHQEGGFNQWDESYPNLETISNDIENNWLFGAYFDSQLAAVISITEDEPVEYLKLQWSQEEDKYVIIHTLCVHESFLRQGVAKELMLFAESYATKNNIKSIRLDTYSLNKGALSFYNKLGYEQVGFVNFPKKTESNYTCFEKVL